MYLSVEAIVWDGMRPTFARSFVPSDGGNVLRISYLHRVFHVSWRRLHNEEINVLYSTPNIVRVIKSRRMRWAGHVARMGEERGVCSVLVGKPEGKRPLGRPRRRWVDNIKMDLQEVGCGHVDWIGLAQDRIGTGGVRL